MADLKPPPPPPRRSSPSPRASESLAAETASTGWKSKLKSGSSAFGKKAMVKGMAWSDSLGHRVNDIAEKRLGSEAFWPVTGDMPKEMDKCARILRAFTVEGVVKEELDPSDPAHKKKQKVLRKIPAKVIAECKGLAIFTAFRSGIAPLGGAGGAGVVVARLEDGSWSAPSSITPNNLSTGLLLGVDIYDCVLVIRSQKALDSFGTHKVTLGTEIGVAAGPYGAGAAVEAGREQAPVFSYVRSRGLYAGVELVGQIFVERYEENGAMYHWPGVKARDILSGKVKVPIEAANLHAALRDAETGRAQVAKGDTEDVILPEEAEDLHLVDGEVLHLPPRPSETDGREQESDPETEVVRRSSLSLPGSGTTTPRKASGPPPPLPTRTRPELVQLHSNDSEYSQDELPPAYVGSGVAVPEKEKFAEDGCAGRQSAPEGLSDAERREWEQHYADQATLTTGGGENPFSPPETNANPFSPGTTTHELVYDVPPGPPPAHLMGTAGTAEVDEVEQKFEKQHL